MKNTAVSFRSILGAYALMFIGVTQAQTEQKVDPRIQRVFDEKAAARGIDLNTPTDPRANHFFRSYDDFVNGVAVPDVLLAGGRTEVMGSAAFEVTTKDGTSKQKVKDLAAQYWGFCNRFGLLHRLFEKDAYLVLVAGDISQYVRTAEVSGTMKADSTFTLNYGAGGEGGYLDYGSVGVNGPIVKLDVSLKGSSKILEEMMAAHPEIYAALLADKGKDNYVKAKYMERENLTFKVQHYVKQFNRL
jgi:hypothetical protein